MTIREQLEIEMDRLEVEEMEAKNENKECSKNINTDSDDSTCAAGSD